MRVQTSLAPPLWSSRSEGHGSCCTSSIQLVRLHDNFSKFTETGTPGPKKHSNHVQGEMISRERERERERKKEKGRKRERRRKREGESETTAPVPLQQKKKNI